MKARLSMAFQDLRGRDGTVVIAKGRSGLKLTPWKAPTNPRTTAQTQVRSYLSRATALYKAMTQSQGNAWRAYGATQVRTNPVTLETYTLTGINAFVELTTKFLQLNPTGTIPMSPPTTKFNGDSITVTASSSAAGTITFTASGANAAGVTTELLIQPLPSLQRKPGAKAYRHAAFKAFASGSLTQNVSVPAGYYAAGYRFVKASTGEATEIVALPVTTVALSLADGGNVESMPAKKKAA